MFIIFFACVALGALVGVLAGMLGIGGGLLIVPALVYLLPHVLDVSLDVAMPMAIATSLSTIVLTAMSSARAHYKLGNLSRHIVTGCSIGIVLGAMVGAWLASVLPGEVVKSVFAYLVMAIAAQMVFGGQRRSETAISQTALVLIGLVVGCISAFMGIGGGALLVPALMWFRVDMKQAIGCAAFCGLVIALFGSASFVVTGWQLHDLPPGAFGYVYLPATVGIVITSVFTARIGAKIGHRLDTRRLKRIFAGFLILVSLRMLLG
ncbi:sulfite exporter TauE/SafE family protein [Aestuariibacter halophilus]|uniref:Probable membrane transporter protein n=1 Tax=Fluctibacter halophilus TaxID=226011 RepID=A0ABS8GCY5_9ALTE|nr:sulfite exporter TauE/SafE family protein [Aestuariibacter halophilus]MCC2617961.1 sulfite exporter TauE/SafE family protein [Aestuariibacter halophilus]